MTDYRSLEDYITLYEALETIKARLDELSVRADFQCDCAADLASEIDDIACDTENALLSIRAAHWSDKMAGNW